MKTGHRQAAVLAFVLGALLNGTLSSDAATAPAPAAAASNSKVDPEAVKALERMSTYLRKLDSFELKADVTQDLVTAEGQRLQLGGVSQYKVRRPNAFQIDVETDFKNRRYFYDGKQFTVFAPELEFYASTPAPGTIRETLEMIRNKFGITLPLEDLFRWNDPKNDRADMLTSGYEIGTSTVDGAETDHYAFREGDRDWEVWIEQGDRPLPRKLVIVDTSDAARPAYIARLSWTVNPRLAAQVFAFKPDPEDKAIHLAISGQ